MTQGIIVGVAIAIVAYTLFRMVAKLITRILLRKTKNEMEELIQEMGKPREVKVKDVLDRAFGPMIAERDRLLKEQEKAHKH